MSGPPVLQSSLLLLILLFQSPINSEGYEEGVRIVSGRGNTFPQKELHIGGVFPMEAGSGGWPGGQACLPAVEMALQDINSDPNVLPNYALRLHYHNSKCQPGLAAKQLFELLYNPPVKLVLLSGCSPVTTMVAESAHVWNLIVLSYGASSPALSNRARFPTLFRTHPSANMQNPTSPLIRQVQVEKITILQSVEEVFTSTAKDLEEQCRERGIRVERQSFYGDPTDAVKTLVRQDARIIVGLFYVTEARRVLCQAYHHGLYGRRYVWFMIGWYADTWYIPLKGEGINCTRKQMEEAAEYHFTTESIMLSRDKMPAISGMTGRQFQRRLEGMISTDPANTGGFPEAPLAYDAVWALALALNCTKNSLPYGMFLEDFSYSNAVMADQMFECVKNTQFKGVSGQVMFSDSGDRIARTQIEQMQKGKYVIIGFYDTTSQTLEWMGNEKFAGGRGPPPDSTIIRHLFVTVNLMLYYSVLFAMMIGLSAAFGLFIFNQKYSYRRIIAQSQPQCNNLLIVGCALCLFSLLLMGLPADEGLAFAEDSFAFLCHTRVSLLMVGFTFAYGSLFAKVWIVHRLGATENQELAAINKEEEDGSPWESIRMLIAAMVGRQALVAAALRKISTHAYGTLIAKRPCRLNQPIPAEKFYSVVGSLFLVDFVIIAFWLAIDPLQRTEQTFHLQKDHPRMLTDSCLVYYTGFHIQCVNGAPAGTDEDVMLLPILELCQSSRQEVWIVLVLGYKGLLLVFGLFLAYESRHLKLRYVNDSRFVHLTICNVSVLSLIIGPIVTFFLRHQANAFFGFVSATVLLCTYIGLGLMFLPKIIYIYNTPHSSDDTANTSSFNDNQRSNIFKSDQLRYLQLVKENNELKRQIEICDPSKTSLSHTVSLEPFRSTGIGAKIKVTECRRLLGKRLVAAGITTTSATQTPKFNKLVTTASTKESTIATDEGFSSATLGRLSSSNVNGCCSSPSNYSSASSTNVAGFITANGTPMAAATAANTIMTLTGMFHSGSMVDNMNRGVEIEVKEGRSFSCSSAAQSTSSSTSSSEEILL